MLNPIDSKLREFPFVRYRSVTEAGLNINQFPVQNLDEVKRLMSEYRTKMVRALMPKFRLPQYTRATDGPLVNTDEALDGIAECFRRVSKRKLSPIRIGINLSRSWDSDQVVAIRGAAILALIQLTKQRGQSSIIEVAYGNGLTTGPYFACHVRIAIPMPTEDWLTRLTCSDKAISVVGHNIIENVLKRDWYGIYRFHEWERHWKQKEYDFVLDRIETCDPDIEYARVMSQLEAFRLT